MNLLQEQLQRSGAAYCLECGKCSAVCPMVRWGDAGATGPRRLVTKAVEGPLARVWEEALFWACLTCKRCSEGCPSAVDFAGFMRDLRVLARREGQTGACTHGDVIATWGRLMTDPCLRQNRLGWLSDDLRVSSDADTLLFVGCLPHYGTLFKDLDIEGVTVARAAVKILNHLGIAPQVMADERCCGHDQLWEGDLETFQALARINLKQLAATGARRIVTTCPECAHTLAVDYPRLVAAHGMEVLHLAEYLDRAGVPIPPPGTDAGPPRRATFQDPCRLGRHRGVYEPPRRLIAALGFELVEMEHARHNSLCCGTSCWTACGPVNKRIQQARLAEAKTTGAGLLITACVKCQIHFKCALADPDVQAGSGIEIRDLTTLIAERLVRETSATNRPEEHGATSPGAR
jgi:Fe-S oxidoreductase